MQNRLPRCRLLAVALSLALQALSATLSFAQAPPPVPALPDTERRTQYSISATTCACSVGFALFGSGTDVDSWLEVWVAGTRYLSTDPSHGWALTSVTGTIATIPRPITDAVLTFTAPQTGVVQIVGANRPRRLNQFQENRGVAARDLNQAISDLVAVERELWDKTNDVTGRAILGIPGEIIAQMPPALARQGGFLCFDATGFIPQMCAPLNGTGNVAGPNSSTSGDFATFSGSTGKLIQDSGIPTAGVAANILNAKIINYQIANTDCGKTVQLGTGSTGFFTVTLPAVSGFAGTCTVTIVNGDTTRGKGLSGFPQMPGKILWPQQSLGIAIVNGAWAITSYPGRWKLPPSGPLVINFDPVNGSDTPGTADGLGLTTGAFRSIEYSLGTITDQFDYDGNQGANPTFITVLNASGAADAEQIHWSPDAMAPGSTGNAAIRIDLNGGSLTFGSGDLFQLFSAAILQIRNGTVSASGNCFTMQGNARLYVLDLMTFGACTGAVFQTAVGSYIEFDSNFTISASSGYFVNFGGGYVNGSVTATISNNITVSNFVRMGGPGTVGFSGMTWTLGGHTVTGAAYFITGSFAAFLDGAASLPGSAGSSNVMSGDCSISPAGVITCLTNPTVVGSLPTCNAGNQGRRAFVTDQATAIAYHGAVTPSGAFKQGVTCDGTAWYQD